MKEKGRINNQGFSLVELVIVIAIMAVLVGIVGTQVIPYIDKARKAKDIQIVNGYCTDATTAFVSCTNQLDVSKKLYNHYGKSQHRVDNRGKRQQWDG